MKKTISKSNYIILIIQNNYICNTMSDRFFQAARNYKKNKALREKREKEKLIKKLFKKHHYKSQVSEETKRILDQNNKSVSYNNRNSNTNITLGYDTLQHFAVVRRYIQRKHKIKIRELELLLFLYPIGLWSQKDYNQFPHSYGTRHVKYLEEKGFVENIIETQSQRGKVYRLTRISKRIVSDFYKLLNGEKQFPETPKHNPFFKGDISRKDMKVAQLIAEFNKKLSGREEKTKHHKKLEKRIKRYHQKKRRELQYEKFNAVRIKIEKERERREKEDEEKRLKLKGLKETLNSYLPE